MTGRPQEEFMSPMTTLVGPGNITGNIRVRCMHHASSANKRLEAYINFSSFFSSRDNFWSWSKDGTMIKSRIRGVATSDGLTSFIELDSVRAFLDALSSNGEIRIKVSVYDGPEIVFRPFMKGGAEFIAKAKSDCGV
jgi:hypothetical protein